MQLKILKHMFIFFEKCILKLIILLKEHFFIQGSFHFNDYFILNPKKQNELVIKYL